MLHRVVVAAVLPLLALLVPGGAVACSLGVPPGQAVLPRTADGELPGYAVATPLPANGRPLLAPGTGWAFARRRVGRPPRPSPP